MIPDVEIVFPPKQRSWMRQSIEDLCYLHHKLHYISQYEGRSANGEVIYLIRKAIEDFEKQHGKIEMP